MVQHSPHHFKVKGPSPATAPSTGREKMANRIQIKCISRRFSGLPKMINMPSLRIKLLTTLFLVAANPDQVIEQRILDTNAGKQLSQADTDV